MTHPYVTIDLAKIRHNAQVVVGLCRARGIGVTGVTKATHGDPEVARAMLDGGVTAIGEARIENIQRLKAAGITAPFMLLTVPPLSEVEAVVETVEISLNSELSALRGLSAAALARGRIVEVVIMVDLGDRREGVLPKNLDGFVNEVRDLAGIRIKGIGTNLSCFGGIVPGTANMDQLIRLADQVEKSLGTPLDWISGANSSGLDMIASGEMPERMNHARIGEAILLGRETTHRRPWPGTFQDAFKLHAEVVELKEKSSKPVGEQAEDAFGHVPVFEDQGDMRRAILNIGREDVKIEGLTPLDPNLSVIGGSSQYAIIDVTRAAGIAVGDQVTFVLNYAALVAAMASDYIEKHYINGGGPYGIQP